MSLPRPPAPVQQWHPLRRLSTIRTGGEAEWFARAGSEAVLVALLRWAREAALPVSVIGSGSNLLIADEGVAGLVLKLDGELAAIECDGAELCCGGGARLPAVAAAAARAGLAGIEFGVNIPGTVGGAVRMNANAYGGRLADVLESVRLATADGVGERRPDSLGFGYRSSSLAAGEIVAAARFRLTASRPEEVRARLAQMRAQRHEAQPQGIRTFGSTFRNPSGSASGGQPTAGVTAGATPGQPAAGATAGVTAGVTPGQPAAGATAGQLLSEAGCNGLEIGGARFAPKHANFIENTGEASTADVLALMAEGRSRVLARFGVALEPEVHTLGSIRFPWRS